MLEIENLTLLWRDLRVKELPLGWLTFYSCLSSKLPLRQCIIRLQGKQIAQRFIWGAASVCAQPRVLHDAHGHPSQKEPAWFLQGLWDVVPHSTLPENMLLCNVGLIAWRIRFQEHISDQIQIWVSTERTSQLQPHSITQSQFHCTNYS